MIDSALISVLPAERDDRNDSSPNTSRNTSALPCVPSAQVSGVLIRNSTPAATDAGAARVVGRAPALAVGAAPVRVPFEIALALRFRLFVLARGFSGSELAPALVVALLGLTVLFVSICQPLLGDLLREHQR